MELWKTEIWKFHLHWKVQFSVLAQDLVCQWQWGNLNTRPGWCWVWSTSGVLELNLIISMQRSLSIDWYNHLLWMPLNNSKILFARDYFCMWTCCTHQRLHHGSKQTCWLSASHTRLAVPRLRFEKQSQHIGIDCTHPSLFWCKNSPGSQSLESNPTKNGREKKIFIHHFCWMMCCAVWGWEPKSRV